MPKTEFTREDYLWNGKPLRGRCGYCNRSVDSTDPNHRVTSIVVGGLGVECVLRGDIASHLGGPLEVQSGGSGLMRDHVGSTWLAAMGAALATEVDRLWPHENDPAYRAACLAEEAGEVNRAITKRRHASHAPDGLCKGKTVDEWTAELQIELAQALGVILDIAHREGFDLAMDVENCVVILQERKAGS